MARLENGGLLGIVNPSTINSARGVFTSKSQYLANLSNKWPRSGSLFFATAHATSPYITAYPFSSLGFGSKFSDPATLPASTAYDATFSPDGKSIGVAHITTPYFTLYPWSVSGFGTKLANFGSSLSGTGESIHFNPESDIVIIGTGTTTDTLRLQALTYSSSTGWGTRFTSLSGLTVTPYGTKINNDTNLVVSAISASPYMRAWVFDKVSGWGSTYSAPSTTPDVGGGDGVVINNASSVIFLAGGAGTGTYNINAYNFTNGVGFGSKISNPASLSTDSGATSLSGKPLALSNNQDAIAVTNNNATYNYIRVWKWNNSTKSFGTEYSAPASIPAGPGFGVQFSPTDDYIAVTHSTSPYIAMYPWNSDAGFGSKISNPSTTPTGTSRGSSWIRV